MLRLPLAATIAALALAPAARAQQLGTIDFPTSGAPAAQAHFITGVLYLHSFEYPSALKEFRDAERLDPGFAMAYWGEAMTYTHPVWDEQDTAAARAALARLGATPAARAAKAPTAREKGYLGAVEILYGAGPKPARDTAYAAAMAAVARDNPGDPEAQLFWALALLGLNQGDRDVPTYLRAGAIAETAFVHHPDHPGAAHYVIHAYDDPAHAQIALAAARAYSRIAPGAAHAQHMTSHIFLALGLWDDVVTANVHAVHVTAGHAHTDPMHNGCFHYNEWLEYGYLQQGRPDSAAPVMAACWARVGMGGRAGAANSYAQMRTAYLVDAGRPDARWLGTLPTGADAETRADLAFGTGYAAFRRGDRAAMAAALAAMDSAVAALAPSAADPEAGRYPPILRTELRAMAAMLGGDTARALALAAAAAHSDDSLPFPFGPPATFKPPHELRGDLFLAARRGDSARAEFTLAIARTPRRPAVVLGLARANAIAGDRAAARAAYAQLFEIWHGAQPGYAPLAEARKEEGALTP